jgi:LPXTG-site transpeptidase (sortase) family protein
LRNIRRQDDILLTTVSGNQVYEVESARVVSPEDVSVLKDTGRPMLTLVTCYPFYYVGSAPKDSSSRHVSSERRNPADRQPDHCAAFPWRRLKIKKIIKGD